MNRTGASPAAPPADTARLQDWLDYQERLHPRGIELGLERVRRVAARLGLPDGGIRTLTVAGTNGKGSSATLASLIYRAAGYRTGLYTSPHLLRYNERVVIDGRQATDADLCRAFAAVEAARADDSLTYFEFGTLAALWLFREARVQLQVLEVGLGGRLDAVNLVDADAALITSIGLDHLDWLGRDRESIAREKAGVFRSGRPAVSAEPDPPAGIALRAAELGAPLAQLGRDFSFEPGDEAWNWRDASGALYGLPLPGLRGEAQLRNASGVLAALARLQALLPVPEAAIRAALPALRLPGRFERRGRWRLDVAHNAEAAAVLAAQLQREPAAWLVLGMLDDKPVEQVLQVLAPHTRALVLAGLPPPRGLAAAALEQRARGAGIVPAAVFGDVVAALQWTERAAAADDPILVCGSFLTVAAATQWLDARSEGRDDPR